MIPLSELRPTRAELAEMIRLASPVVLAQVGVMLMGVVDTAMVGRVGADAVAAVALGHIYWVNLTILGVGILMALDPVVSQAFGAGDVPGVRKGVQRGVVLALLLTIPVMLALMPSQWVFTAVHQPASVIPVAARWARWSSLGALPFFLFMALSRSLNGMGNARPALIAIITGNVVNVVLNWLLIYGHGGFPALGAVGSSVSTVVGRWVMLAVMLYAGRALLIPALKPWLPASFHMRPLMRMVAIGAPVAFQQWLEIGVFSGGAMVLGWFGPTALASHEIAISLAALTFMVPLGLSAASASMVGRAIGRGDMPAARRDAVAAIAVGLGFMTAAALVFGLFPRQLAGLFIADPETLTLSASLISIAALFQMFDGIQGVATGVLRGTADTRVPMLIHLGGFWGIGAPVGLWLALRTSLGPRGVWWGYVAALIAVAGLQLWRVRWRLAGHIARLQVEHTAEHPVPSER